MSRNKSLYRFIKRSFDIVNSFLLILILLVPFFIIAILIKFDSKGSVFYLSPRLGKNKKKINVIKFRTMRMNSDNIKNNMSKKDYKKFLETYKLNNDPRVTKLGKFLRKSSIDELPQIFNIFIGEMSFVGPRPIVIDEYNKLWNNDETIFKMRPGLTGNWGVNGRSLISYKERISLEDYYVNNCSITFDIKILFKTIKAVFSSKGAV